MIALGKDSFYKHKFFCPGKTKVTASPSASKQEECPKIEEGNILHPDCFLSTIAGENIAAVALSLRGKNHIAQGMVLQDYHKLQLMDDQTIFVVVADGVGSEPRADEGAEIACTSAAAYFDTHISDVKKDPRTFMKHSFKAAKDAIAAAARSAGIDARQMNTTLHAAWMTEKGVWWGHAGDGGIFLMDDSGTLEMPTEPMTAENGEYVIPLLAGEAWWQFGFSEGHYQSVLLCTDGIYGRITNRALRSAGIAMDKAMAATFLSPWAFDWQGGEGGVVRAMSNIFRQPRPSDFYPRMIQAMSHGGDTQQAERHIVSQVLPYRQPLASLTSISDDITLAVIQRKKELPQSKPVSYYFPPDYHALNDRIAEILYSE